MAKTVHLFADERPHRGHTDVFINPDEVSAVYRNGDDHDNPTIISMKNGQKFAVEGWPDDVNKKLFPS